jgi:hypothetical protein
MPPTHYFWHLHGQRTNRKTFARQEAEHMRKAGRLGIFFAGRKQAADESDMSSEALRDEQLADPLTYEERIPDTALVSALPPTGSDRCYAPTATLPGPSASGASKPALDPPDGATAAAKPVIGRPHMTASELALLDRLLKSGLKRYLEFGSGGSTLLAVRSGIETIVSVESDAVWAETAAQHDEISPLVRAGRATVIHADIGPTKAFGAPVDEQEMGRWPNYIRLPWAEWHRRNAMPDFVFVDGRFRVAACLSVIVAWQLSRRETPFPLIAIHDVLPERRSYQRLFEYFESSERAESLHVLRLKESADHFRAFTTLLGVQFDPS